MRKLLATCVTVLAASMAVTSGTAAQRVRGAPSFKHVLMVSIDGAHAVDVARYIEAYPDSALAQLSGMSLTYTQASLPIGDFFPGMMSLMTGGTPNSTGVWYDEGYDRTLSAAGSNCSSVGSEYVFDEKLDNDVTRIDGGGGINEAKLPRDPKNGCKPVYPHQFLRVNTIFDVAKAAGMRTAWSDKHWACEIVEGHTGHGVEDLYIREEGTGAIASNIARTESVDDQRVQAIINEIDGYDHDRTHRVGTPGIFGMTFQAMAVEQKEPNGGGYLDGDGTPTPAVLNALAHTDESLGRIVAELKKRNLLSSTLVIVTAVHGDSPFDRRLARNIDEDLLPDMIGDNVVKSVADTEAFLWLKDQSQTAKVAAMLMSPQNRSKAAINEVVWGEALKLQFNDPLKDPRTPDLIVKPLLGVFYASPKSTKIAEHGGFYTEDVNVPLLLANPHFKATVIKTPVPTTEVAPTIMAVLGLDPKALQSVKMEKTPVLPGLL